MPQEPQKIQELLATKTAPKVTKEYILSRIVNVTWDHCFRESTRTICIINLDNGYSAMGESSCVSKENYDPAIGEHYSYANAFSKLWPLFGFALAEQLYQAKKD